MLMRQRIAMDVNLNWKWEALGVRGLLFPEPESISRMDLGKDCPLSKGVGVSPIPFGYKKI